MSTPCCDCEDARFPPQMTPDRWSDVMSKQNMALMKRELEIVKDAFQGFERVISKSEGVAPLYIRMKETNQRLENSVVLTGGFVCS